MGLGIFKKVIRRLEMSREDWLFAKEENRINKLRAPFIKSVLPKNGIGAELGVFRGQFSPSLLYYTEAVELHLVDPWYLLTGYWHWGGGNRSTIDAVIKILKTWKREIEVKKVFVHIGDDRVVLKTFPDSYFNWVYIDSSHEYNHTLEELKILKFKVKPDGVIAGDDWQPDPSNRHHGVFKAVNEFIETNGYSIIYMNNIDRQWAIRKSL